MFVLFRSQGSIIKFNDKIIQQQSSNKIHTYNVNNFIINYSRQWCNGKSKYVQFFKVLSLQLQLKEKKEYYDQLNWSDTNIIN